MRTLNSAKNLLSSLGITLIMTLLGFLTRKVFVDNVGVEYLGLNGLLQNILGVVTLLEGGFGTSIVYNLYKPLAERDEARIIALVQLYRKVYRYIAGGIFIFSLCLYPFIDLFIKDVQSLSYVSIVYFIFVFNSIVQYFTAYKWSLINADQQVYKLTVINLTYQVGLSFAKLGILYFTQNYILYLVVESLFGIGLNIAIVHKVNQLYPFIVTKVKYTVDKETKKKILTNVKALFLHSLGGYFMHSTSNVVISSFVGVVVVGLYSNYTLLTGFVNTISNQVLNSFSESVGNLIATETDEKAYSVFRTIFFVNFLITSSFSVIMYHVLTPFVCWWLGEQYVMNNITLLIIVLNFYINGMRSSAQTFKVKSGIFIQDRYSPLLQGIINLILSLILVRVWGLNGVLFAFGFSILSIGFWQFPRLVYKYTFHKPLWNYFKIYLFYTMVGIVVCFISLGIIQLVSFQNLLFQACFNGIVCLVCLVVVYLLCFHKREEYRTLLLYVDSLKNRL